MQKIKMASEQAVLLSIKDSSLHPFFQKYPFLNGNDPITRTAALKSLRGSIVVRNSNSDVEINRLDATDVIWGPTKKIAPNKLSGIRESRSVTSISFGTSFHGKCGPCPMMRSGFFQSAAVAERSCFS
jgi:hypothetical protein